MKAASRQQHALWFTLECCIVLYGKMCCREGGHGYLLAAQLVYGLWLIGGFSFLACLHVGLPVVPLSP